MENTRFYGNSPFIRGMQSNVIPLSLYQTLFNAFPDLGIPELVEDTVPYPKPRTPKRSPFVEECDKETYIQQGWSRITGLCRKLFDLPVSNARAEPSVKFMFSRLRTKFRKEPNGASLSFSYEGINFLAIKSIHTGSIFVRLDETQQKE